MGSSLESESGVGWGLHRLGWYVKAWTRRESALDELMLSKEERKGRYGRIRATGLLQRPAWAPFLQGIEPYGALLAGIRDVVVHQDAICSFPYDWRLPVAHNATLLERNARAHLAAWKAHPEYQRFRDELPDSRPARLVIVAHSMGGLLTRTLPNDLNIRATVTLATPFDGAAKAALILNTGRGTPLPLPRERLRTMAKTLPGLHDLLPTYRCLDDVDGDTEPARLPPELVEDIGGDRELATASFAWHAQVGAHRPAGHRPLIWIKQPTDSSLTLRSGVLAGHGYTFEPTIDGLARDRHGILVRNLRDGDGTVPYNSALPGADGQMATLAQQHGPIAKSKESIGRFSHELDVALRHTFADDQEISVTWLAEELQRRLGGEYRPLNTPRGAVLRRVIPIAGGYQGPLDARTQLDQVIRDLPDDERRHFLTKAQGGELSADGGVMGEPSWHFTGRTRERYEVLDRLGRGGMTVVTGRAGSGKSALLGDIVVRSRPVLAGVLLCRGVP
jgi:Lecithin:cholesterol acyltransferase